MPCPGKKVLHAYLTPEEYEQMKSLADQAGISLSTYVKRVGLGQRVRSLADQEAVRALMKANGDLGRLGGLFKMAITEGRIREMQYAEFRQTLRRLEKGQAQVVACCRAVVESLNRRS